MLEDFTQTLFAIRERHANTVPIMAEAVMEVKRNYGKTFLNYCVCMNTIFEILKS